MMEEVHLNTHHFVNVPTYSSVFDKDDLTIILVISYVSYAKG